VFRFQGRMLRD